MTVDTFYSRLANDVKSHSHMEADDIEGALREFSSGDAKLSVAERQTFLAAIKPVLQNDADLAPSVRTLLGNCLIDDGADGHLILKDSKGDRYFINEKTGQEDEIILQNGTQLVKSPLGWEFEGVKVEGEPNVNSATGEISFKCQGQDGLISVSQRSNGDMAYIWPNGTSKIGKTDKNGEFTGEVIIDGHKRSYNAGIMIESFADGGMSKSHSDGRLIAAHSADNQYSWACSYNSDSKEPQVISVNGPGQNHTFTRNSAGYYENENGFMFKVIANGGRITWKTCGYPFYTTSITSDGKVSNQSDYNPFQWGPCGDG